MDVGTLKECASKLFPSFASTRLVPFEELMSLLGTVLKGFLGAFGMEMQHSVAGCLRC